MRTFFIATLLLALPAVSARASGTDSSILERKAFFEATQVVQQFFLCLADAANADERRQDLDAADACLRRTLDPNVVVDVNGNIIQGVDALLGLIRGPLSQARTSTSITPAAFVVTQFDIDRSGTQTIGVATNDTAIQMIVAPSFLFGDVLGGQAVFARDSFTLTRARRGDWVISADVARVLAVEPRPDLFLMAPFPRFESPRSPER